MKFSDFTHSYISNVIHNNPLKSFQNFTVLRKPNLTLVNHDEKSFPSNN